MKIIKYIFQIRFIPYIIVFYFSKEKELLLYEMNRWLELNRFNRKGLRGFLFLLNLFPEYRSLFIHRTGCNWLSFFAQKQTNLYFHTPSCNIGKGLVLWHGYSTILNAKQIGENCEIWQMVTIGKKTTNNIDDKPIIGNNVKICAHSIVIGDIKIDDNSIIGAGCTVNHSCNNGDVLIGYSAKIRTNN